MKFTPVGRYLLVEPIEIATKKKKSEVLLPDSYKPTGASRFKMCRVNKIGAECTRNVRTHTLIVVENSMVEKIEVLENTFYVILETHVIGTVDEQTQ